MSTFQTLLLSSIAAFLFGIASASGVAYKLHKGTVAEHEAAIIKLEAKKLEEKKEAVSEARKAEQLICDNNNQIAMEGCNALQTRFDSTNARYVKLLQYGTAGACVPARTIANASRRADETPGADMPAVQVPIVDGLTAGKLNDDQAAQLLGLQETVAAIYKANGQSHKLPKEWQ